MNLTYKAPEYLSYAVRQFAWPLLLLSSGWILWFGFDHQRPTIAFNLSYAWIIGWLLVLERKIPFRHEWSRADGQLGPDLGHTILNKGLVQLLIIWAISLGFVQPPFQTMLSASPMWLQVTLGLVASEFTLYWAHRLAHECPLIWRFHAVHHSVKRLWLVNTGRFHFIDSLLSVIAAVSVLFMLGVSMDAIIWVSAITAYIGILTHCNADIRCGWWNYIFNTPNLHRWHHSTDTSISNNNYGENLMCWDMLFGTYLHRPEASVSTIGIDERMPKTFTGQLIVPFIWARYQSTTRI